ncbi:helix-turn-helix transcriptional regulator [Sphingomonas phyllosphaerae]|uniref:helix-turn-helix transcriptional regulator n=1 Tax=Sphingomonas phyllosphaerae TaxID=257003 RepID=UPI0003B36981|nr:AlpA family phage regulatory protein [Sphingomonas phyllosphaerae]
MSAELWRLPRVIEVTGLSKTEIYRRVSQGQFPKSRPYKDIPNKRFWISTEVQRWQAEQVGEDEWAALLSVGRKPDDYDALLG